VITMRDHFGGSEFWWGDQGVVWVFLCKRLPELFTHTIVWVYWLPTVKLGSLLTLERFFQERYPRECKPIAVIVLKPVWICRLQFSNPVGCLALGEVRTNINPWGQDSYSWDDNHAIIDILRNVSGESYF